MAYFTRTLLLTVSVAALACSSSPSGTEEVTEGAGSRSEHTYVPGLARTEGKLDLLFVIDASASMKEEQSAIREAIDGFIESLHFVPSLHVGVINSEIDLEGHGPGECSGIGGGGGLLHVSRNSGDCLWGEPFISDDISGPAYVSNYPGDMTFADAFSCLADVGTAGCGFEQPLAAVELALDGRNPAFRRAAAALGIVFITDEDDCSTSDFSLFDESASLGPLTSFRCTEKGIVCDQPIGDVGEKTGCRSDETSDYLQPTGAAAARLMEAAGGSENLFVATIAGPSSDVEVVPSQIYDGAEVLDALALQPSCDSDDGVAVPAVRLSSYSGSLADAGVTSVVKSICTIDSSLLAVGDSLALFMDAD